jgi:transcriptional regulator with XRE-family HTH domain
MNETTKNHYIPEWASHRHLTRADISREIGADRSLVSRWFAGTIPSERWLEPLANLFGVEVAAIFRHPDDDWLAKFFRDKTEEQKEAAIEVLKIFFRENPKEIGAAVSEKGNRRLK